MIKIIGTDHLMKKEVIEELISKESPEIICVELCKTGFDLMVVPKITLQEKAKSSGEDKSLLGKISNSIKDKAEKEGIEYGSDQINSCLYAIKNGIQLEFVDLDVSKIRELMDIIPEAEKVGFMKELAEFDKQTLEGVTMEKDVDKLLVEMKSKFPIAFEFLVNYRNLVIINNLLKIERRNPHSKIVAVLGKGHEHLVERGVAYD